MATTTLDEIAAGAVFGLAIGGSWCAVARSLVVRRRELARATRRSREAMLAVTEASLEEEAFSPAAFRQAVDEIVAVATVIWRGDAPPPRDRSDIRVIEQWARSVSASLGVGSRLVRVPVVDVLRVTNRSDECEDRLVLRVRLRIRAPHRGPFAEPFTVTADLRWTLERVGHLWRLLSVDGDPLSPRVLNGRLIPVDWTDEERLREAALIELGAANALDAGADLGALVSAGQPPDRQLSELAQLDDRFDPSLLTVRLAHIVETWEGACTGAQEPLADVCTDEVLDTLLHPATGHGRLRLVLRDATLDDWTPTRLELSDQPPRIQIELTVSAVG